MARSCYAESVPAGERRCGSSRAQLELAQDVRDVTGHGVLAENESRRDVPVGQSLGDEIEHLQFASAETSERTVGRVGANARNRLAEVPEHALAAVSLAVGSDLAKARDRGFDLTLCLV